MPRWMSGVIKLDIIRNETMIRRAAEVVEISKKVPKSGVGMY